MKSKHLVLLALLVIVVVSTAMRKKSKTSTDFPSDNVAFNSPVIREYTDERGYNCYETVDGMIYHGNRLTGGYCIENGKKKAYWSAVPATGPMPAPEDIKGNN